MSRIVVTGAKGGTGRAIVDVLRHAGDEVVQVDRVPNDPGADRHVELDLRDAAGVNDVFAGADAVIHFGSPPGDAHLTATEAFSMLTAAGFNVFQAAHNVGIRRVVWASSIEVYGDINRHPELPVTEDSPLAPPRIYACSKLLLERLAIDFARWHGMSIAGLRLSRIIYDSPSGRARLKQLVEDETLGVDCLWSYVDARDVAGACQAWLKSDIQGAHVFNVAATNVHHDVPTRKLLDRHGFRETPLRELDGEHDTPFSTRRLREMLGWRAAYDWRDILSEA